MVTLVLSFSFSFFLSENTVDLVHLTVLDLVRPDITVMVS